MTLTLSWGLRDAVPDDAIGAYGARAIVDQGGLVDIVYDRQDFQGDAEILEVLAKEFPLTELQGTVRDLLRSGWMNIRVAEPFVLYQSERVTVVANTNASAGYCYIAAWVVKHP